MNEHVETLNTIVFLVRHRARPSVQPVAPPSQPLRPPLPRAGEDTPFKARLRKGREEEARLRKRIERAVAARHMLKAMRLRDAYLRSFSARLAAVVEENNKRPLDERAAEAELLRIVSHMDVWRPCHELVVVSARPKANGRYRPIMSFGLQHRARQRLVAKAIIPFLCPHPGQYAVQGGGRNAACDAIITALRDGYKWVVRLDVAEFYLSVDPRRVERLIPAPRKVVDACMVSDRLNLAAGDSIANATDPSRDTGAEAGLSFIARSRSGIPQGSPVSNLVAEMLLAPVLALLPERARVIAYADDILVLTQTKREAEAHLETLRRALGTHPAGSLQLKHAEIHRASDGFNFLGYRFRVRKGTATAEPPQHKQQVNVQTAYKLLAVAERCPKWLPVLRQRVKSWFAAYPLWETGQLFAALLLERIAALEAEEAMAGMSIKPAARTLIAIRHRTSTPAPIERALRPPYLGPRLTAHDGPIVAISAPTR